MGGRAGERAGVAGWVGVGVGARVGVGEGRLLAESQDPHQGLYKSVARQSSRCSRPGGAGLCVRARTCVC